MQTTEKSAVIILFGATGDLAARKLYPALFHLYLRGSLKDHFAVVGTARRPWTDEHYRDVIVNSLEDLTDVELKTKQNFAQHFYYQSHDVTDAAHYVTLKDLAATLDDQYQAEDNRIFYMAMAPKFFGTIASHLHSEKLLTQTGFNRVVIEKPFGHDYESAKVLNDALSHAFSEDQIYRIDHYLGKEMIQNILPLRFSNPILAAAWNHHYIDNIQVTLAESVGVEERAGYYEGAGALRDMIQNHVLQILSLLTMEEPVSYSAENVRREKNRLFASLHIDTPEEVQANFVRGQYAEAKVNDQSVPGYRQEQGISPDSLTETFVAGKVQIENTRWMGVPIYIRTGKRLSEKDSQIDIVFKKPALNIFNQPVTDNAALEANVLSISIEPTERIKLCLNGKSVGQAADLRTYQLGFTHDPKEVAAAPEAYERLLLDVLRGDATNFTHWSELAKSWHFVDAIRQTWDAEKVTELMSYPAGSMGPKEADELLTRDQRHWYYQPNKVELSD